MILFDDSEWEYNFIILMTVIFIVCGIYTFIKIQRQKKKEQQQIINNKKYNKNNKKKNNVNKYSNKRIK